MIKLKPDYTAGSLAELYFSDNSKKNEVYASVRQAIISGHLEQGVIINEGELARQYRVSRTPVREALLILAVEGLVTCLPRTGYMVTQITVRDVQEAFHLREILEVEAIRLAVGRIDAEVLEALEAKKIGDPPELNPEFNREFHLLLARASGNMRLARLVAQLLDEMERMLIYDPVYTDPTPFEHEQILVALKASDAEVAQEAVRYHVQAVKSRILERFQ